MRIPDDIKQDILKFGASNIASIIGDYLPITKAGKGYTGCCPFHGEKTPSFHVSPERGTWHCFGSCSDGGDVAKFIMQMDSVNFPEALMKLAARGGIAIPGAGETAEEKERKTILSALAKAEKLYRESLAADTAAGRAYVESRMTPAMVESFGIGFAPANGGKFLYNKLKELGISEETALKAGLIREDKNGKLGDTFWGGRVMFPVKSKNGYTIGFAGRRIDAESQFKYTNSPETAVYKKYSALFGLDKCSFSSGEVFVVEGYLDLMQMRSHGIFNAVAACGTAFTKEHITTLKTAGVRRLNLMFDGDKAGIKATQKAITLACTEEVKVRVWPLPADQDPDSFFKTGGKLEDVKAISGFEYLEQSGIELGGTVRELRRLERTEKALVYITAQIPAVAELLKKRGNLEELFSQDAIDQLQGYF